MSIGTSPSRRDAPAKASGEALYPDDLHAPESLFAKVVFSNQPHARMLSMDISETMAVPRVVEVVTAADIPLNEYGLTMFDQPVLIGTDGTGESLVPSDISRWEADQIALVVAETKSAALEGAQALRVEWEQLEIAGDIASADTGNVLVHPENGLDTNTFYEYKIKKGDMELGWSLADVVVEGTYQLPYQEHAFLQPEAALAYIDAEGRPTVEVAGQWTHEDQGQVAHALQLPPDQVRIIYPAIGGAFGGREDMSVQIVLAAAALKLKARGIDRPVRTVWNREESMVGHHKRHRATITAKWGATKDGMIVVVDADGAMDAGAYNYTSNKVLSNVHLSLTGPYNIPNARVDARAVYTHSVPGGAFRGFGGPQGSFVAETQMNKVAAALGMDPVEIRLKNVLKDGDNFITQVPMLEGVSIGEVVEVCAAESGWSEPLADSPTVTAVRTLQPNVSSIRSGKGVACALKNVGFTMGFPERCEATITLSGADRPAGAHLAYSGADVGQGGHTAALQMTAYATGLDLAQVEGTFSDTATSGDSGSASASRLTYMSGHAIKGAAEVAQAKWDEGHRPAVGHYRFEPPATDIIDPETGVGQPLVAVGYVAEVVEVSVDIETGHIRVGRVFCATDVGNAINPDQIRGQAEGAIAQAHGYALSEKLIVEEGRLKNPTFSGYLLPGTMDMPQEINTIILEVPDPSGPWGVRGMAEMPLVPYAPALVAALHDATGVWFNEFPLTPDRVLAGLKAAQLSQG